MRTLGVFLIVSCLAFAGEPEATLEFGPQQPETKPEAVSETNQPPAPESSSQTSSWRGSIEFGGIGAFSTVEDQPDFSGGLGWNIGLQAEWVTQKGHRFSGAFGYQQLSIAKYISSSGGAVLDQYSEYIQTQSGPYGQLFWGTQILASSPESHEKYELFWDLGIEYFRALDAYQETSFNTFNEFDPSQFIFAITGVSIAWKIRGDWELLGHGRFFINTVGESQWRLMGTRLTLALSIPL